MELKPARFKQFLNEFVITITRRYICTIYNEYTLTYGFSDRFPMTKRNATCRVNFLIKKQSLRHST